MAKTLKQKLLILGIIIGIILFVSGIGYYFAKQKSEPEFDSKIDRIMFERKNKSPKYIITLPDKFFYSRKEEFMNAKDKKTEVEKDESYEQKLQRLMKETPHIGKLKNIEGKKPLPLIESSKDLESSINEITVPATSPDGKKPWIEYAMPPKEIQPNFFKVAILINGMGLNYRMSEELIGKFPSEVGFAFSPYGRDNKKIIQQARQQGHETYADLLLASKDFLKSDSGPLSLSITASLDENKLRVYKTLSGAMPTGGIVINDGMAGDDSRPRIKELLEDVGKLGLLMIDATGEDDVSKIELSGIPRRKADIVIKDDFRPETIKQQLKEAEFIAQEKGSVLIVSGMKASAIRELSEWINTFSPQLSYQQMKEQGVEEIERPFALVPISSTVTE